MTSFINNYPDIFILAKPFLQLHISLGYYQISIRIPLKDIVPQTYTSLILKTRFPLEIGWAKRGGYFMRTLISDLIPVTYKLFTNAFF